MSLHSTPTRVLVVDDDAMSRDLLSVLLEAEGYAVESADSGEAALELLCHGEASPDVVLADVQMPGITGAQLARKLRGACGPATLLLAISGSQPPAKVISLFNGFLTKPFKMDQVAVALRAWRDRAKPEDTAEPERAITSARTSPPQSKLPSITAAPAPTDASKPRMEVEAKAADGDQGNATGSALVLNENIYRQLAASMPAQQLREMYMMCVNDARHRIVRMRRLAADRDSAQFIREAHSIKGGCGMLGATELHRMASELEEHGLDPATPGEAQDVNFLDKLSAACDRLESMLGSRVY